MKKLITLLLFLAPYLVYSQQTGRLTGKVVDGDTEEPIIGAVVELAPVSDTLSKKHSATGYDGQIDMPGLRFDRYLMRVTFLGYEDLVTDISVDKARTDAGTLVLFQTSQRIEDIVLEVHAVRTSQRGDTVIYNADAFKVARDADTETLLSKMPGITIIDGEVEAQGESVKKVFVDGKEFFGQDVTSAIRNLPAEVVSKIEVYNKLSDQAEFTGVDDGEGFKAINIVTTVNRGQFGKLYASYGFNDKYSGGGNLNMFSGDHRFSFIGMTNNINDQNFSMEDILGAMGTGSGQQSRGGGRQRNMRGAGSFMLRPQDGVSTVSSFGTNYSGIWGKQKKVEVSGDYFFNTTKNENFRTTDREYYSSSDTVRRYLATSESNSRNYENRINARIEYKINENHSLMFRPRISLQSYKSNNINLGENWESLDGIKIYDLNSFENKSNSNNNGYNISNSIHYRARLGKPGRTLSVHANGSMNKNDRKGINDNLTVIALMDSTFRQRTMSNSSGYNLEGNFTYTEPLGQYSNINVQYRAQYRYSDSDRKAYLWDEMLQIYDPAFSEEYSNIYNSGYLIHRAGPGYNFSKNRDVFTANIYYQRSSLTGNQDYPLPEREIKAEFNDITYFARLDKNFNSQNTLRLHAGSSTNNPSVNQLQDVVDISNTQFVTAGNPDLKPVYNHNMFARYALTSVTKGRSLMVMGGFNIQSNYIADDIILLQGNQTYVLPNGEILSNGAQFTRPENMSGRWSANGMVNYGTPVRFLRSNLNVNIGVNYNETPSIINSAKNLSKNQFYNGGITLGSNISEYIDFTVTWNGGYNIARNTIRRDNDNEYFSQGATVKFKWVIWAGITFSGNAAFSQYKGITDDFNEKYIICNLYIGKKVFRNHRGEITFGVNDLFDQNTSFTRNITSTYIENVRNNTLGRYFGFQFTYNLRNFGGSPSASSGRGGPDMFPGPGGRPPGPPPGGFNR